MEMISAGRLAGRTLAALGRSGGDVLNAIELASASSWIDSDEIIATIEKSAIGGLDVATVGTAGIFGNAPVDTDFISSAREFSLLQRLNANPALPRTRIYTGSAVVGERLTEGAGMSVVLSDLTPATLVPVAHGALGVVTKEILRLAGSSGSPVDAWLSRVLAVAAFEAEDRSLLDPAYTGSITNGLTATSSSGTTAAQIDTDLAALIAAFTAGRGDLRRAVLVTSPSVAVHLALLRSSGQRAYPDVGINTGVLGGLPLLVSLGADVGATSLIVIVDQSKLWTYRGPSELAVSNDAALQMDSAPTQSSTTPTATTTVSMFQTNSVALKAVVTASWKAGTGGVQYISGIAL